MHNSSVQKTKSDFEDIGAKLDAYIESAGSNIRKLLPGAVAGLSDFLFPVCIKLEKPFRSIRIELTCPQREILNFSRCEFFGIDRSSTIASKKGDIVDVSTKAVCSQSSTNEKQPSPQSGVTGKLFVCNVHTAKEHNPWWQADFPDEIHLKRLFFFNRMDKYGIRSESIRIVGIGLDGTKYTLYHPCAEGNLARHTKKRISDALVALQNIRAQTDVESVVKFDASLHKFKTLLSTYLTQANKPPSEECETLTNPLIKVLTDHLQTSPDFGTHRNSGQLVHLDKSKVRYVRVRSVGRGLQHIGGLEISRKGRWRHPKWRTQEEKYPLGYKILAHTNPQTYRYNLRDMTTQRLFDFEKPRVVSQLRLWNASTNAAGQATFMEVYTSADKKNWTCVFDSWQHFRHVIDALQLVTLFVKISWSEDFSYLMGKLLGLYRCQNMSSPVRSIVRGKSTLSKAFGNGTEAARQMVKHARPLRLTKHGLQIPLMYRDQKRVLNRFIETRDAITAAGYTPILLYGTLLGAIREKDFIPHDDDLDIAIIVDKTGPEDIDDAKIKIAEKLQNVGLPCRAGGTAAPIVHYRSSDVNIDIFILGRQGETIYWPHKNLKIVPERSEIFLPTNIIEFKGHRFHTPRSPASVSEARYGKDWQTPNQFFEL